MTKTLKRIEPVKFGIVLGIFYGLISLIFIPFFLLGALASLLMPASQSTTHQAIGVGVGLIFCFVVPVLYAVIGGLFGMLAAWLYNVVAGWVGGIEFEVE